MIDYNMYQKLGVNGLVKLASQNPNDAEVHFKLGLAFADEGNLDSAIDSWIESTRLDQHQEFPSIHYLGRALLDKGRFDIARDTLIAGLATISSKLFAAQSYTLLGEAYEGLEQPQDAVNAYLEATNLNCNQIGAHDALFRLSLNRDLTLPKPVLRSELITDEQVKIETSSKGVCEFRVRIFDCGDFKLLLTSPVSRLQLSHILEGGNEVTNLIQQKYDLDLMTAIWMDFDPASSRFGFPPLTQIRLSFNEMGIVRKCKYDIVELKRFEELTGFRIMWKEE